MNKLFFYLNLFLFINNYGQTVGTIMNSEESLDGYTLFAPNTSTITCLIDNCGKIINSWESEYDVGLSVYY